MRSSERAGAMRWRAFGLRWPRKRYRILEYEAERMALLEERSPLLARVHAKKSGSNGNSQREVAGATRRLRAIETQLRDIDTFVGRLVVELPRRRIPSPLGDLPSAPEWVLEAAEGPTPRHRLFHVDPFSPEAKARALIYRVALPPGGIFLPMEDGTDGTDRAYNPLGPEGDGIWLDAQAIQSDDTKDLLRFVSEWGILGVGIPGAPACRVDGVELTGQRLRKLVAWFRAIHQLQRGKATKSTRDELTEELLAELKLPLGSQSAIEYLTTGQFTLRSLWDALCVRLWENLHGELRLRYCTNDRCRRIFVPRRKNQRFCTWACGNRWTVRRWKQRQRERQRS